MAIWVVDGVFRICRQPPIGVSNTVLCGVVIYLGLLRSERQIFNHAWVFLRSERQCCSATSLIYTPETHQCGSMMQNACLSDRRKTPAHDEICLSDCILKEEATRKTIALEYLGIYLVTAPQLACMAVRMSAHVMRGVQHAWMCATSGVRCYRVMCY